MALDAIQSVLRQEVALKQPTTLASRLASIGQAAPVKLAYAKGRDQVEWSGDKPAAARFASYGLKTGQVVLAADRAVGGDAATEAADDAFAPAAMAPFEPTLGFVAPMIGAPAAPGEETLSDDGDEDGDADADAADGGGGKGGAAHNPGELTDEEEAEVAELKKTDAAVRRHEQAHVTAAGGYARGGPSYEYQRGPDGQSYAVGGEVAIDVTPERSAEATIRKMQVVQRAALAPSDPSPQDRSVAARAAQLERRARVQLATEEKEEAEGATEEEAEEAATTDTAAGAPVASLSTDAETPVAGGFMDARLSRLYTASPAPASTFSRVA